MAVSTLSGRSPRTGSHPAAANAATASANRTVPRTCPCQYPAVPSCSSVASSPVAVDTNGTTAGLAVTPSRTCPYSASIGSIRCEWNACDTRNLRVFTSSDASNAAICSSRAGHAPPPGDRSRPPRRHRRDPTRQGARRWPASPHPPATPASDRPEPPPPDRRPPATTPPPRARRPAHRSNDPRTKSGFNTPRLRQPEQRHLDREQSRLRPPRLVENPVRVGEHHLPQITVQATTRSARTHLVQRRPRTPGTPSASSRPMPTRCAP